MKDNRYKIYIESSSTGSPDHDVRPCMPSGEAVHDLCETLRNLGQNNTGAFDRLTPRQLISLVSRLNSTVPMSRAMNHVQALCLHHRLRQADVTCSFKQAHREGFDEIYALISDVLHGGPQFTEEVCWEWMRKTTTFPVS